MASEQLICITVQMLFNFYQYFFEYDILYLIMNSALFLKNDLVLILIRVILKIIISL